MRFGKTSREKFLLKQLGLVQRAIGVWKFAWWPTRMIDGKTIWFENYYEVQQHHIYHTQSGDIETSDNAYPPTYCYYKARDCHWVFYSLKPLKKGWYSSDFEQYNSEESYQLLLNFRALLEQELSALN